MLKILCYEVCFLFVKDKYWMIGLGMFFVNLFWGFEVEIQVFSVKFEVF